MLERSNLINNILPTMFISIIFIFIYIFRHKLYRKIRLKNELLNKFLPEILSNFKVRLNNWKITILLPFILAIVIDQIIFIIFGQPINLPRDYTFFERIKSITFTPIFEEFVYRGAFFGVLFISVPKMISRISKKRWKRSRCSLIFIGLFLQALLFASLHNNPNLGSVCVRFFGGLLFGLLYILNKRNLLPAMIAHMAGNLSLHFLYYLAILTH